MRLSVIFFVCAAFISAVFAGSIVPSDRDALIQACREIGEGSGSTKVRLEFDLPSCPGGGCRRRKRRNNVEDDDDDDEPY